MDDFAKITVKGKCGKVSLHNHSIYSDGGGSLEEMCRAGKEAGIEIFGISDHWVCRPWKDEEVRWWMEPEKLDEYVEELLRLKKILDDDSFSLKIGLEVDFFFENIDDVLAHLAAYPLDYLIGSVHYAGTFPIDYDISCWKDVSPEKKDDICRVYWEKLAGAAARKEFAFIGHLDLPKKFALIDNNKYYGEACRVLDIIADNGGCLELNTSGWFKNCAEQYPSEKILQEAAKRCIPAIISADAHIPEDVCRNFTAAADLLARCGFQGFSGAHLFNYGCS